MTGDDDGFDIDDSDYDIYIEEVNFKISLWHFCFLYGLNILKCPVLSGSLISGIIMWWFSSVRMSLLPQMCNLEGICFFTT